MQVLATPLSAIQSVPVLPIDVTSVVAVVMGLMVVLIPVAGLTARFALKPIAEAVARMKEAQGTNRELQLVEQRLSLIEQQLSSLEREVRQIEEKSDFDRRLTSGTDDGALA
ncbi:MAG: hypothetical protein R3195_16925 [Gemmatimonadota bacterium]|nr:hypothetical protein [Gemmatimonadota bacterium]